MNARFHVGFFRKKILSVASLALAGIVAGTPVEALSGTADPAQKSAAETFSFGGKNGEEFLLNGKPFQIRAGEIHPQRIPREYWDHRIKMCKAMGLNTIAFYAMWNDFEQADGSFDFKTGRRDLAAFFELCQANGMWVLFRPGPYICGEWDFGGLPAYLLKDKNARIRTTADATFMRAQERYLKAIAAVAEPYLLKNGGPILMTQIENEYGSWPRKEASYLRWLKDFWEKEGFGPFYMSDGGSDRFLRGLIYPDKNIAVGLDPGTNDTHFAAARRANPGTPIFSSETYPGWLRRWGEGNWKPSDISRDIKWFMENKFSFSVFPVHGGTNFGFTAGANDDSKSGGDYHADVTSYDYGSPIDEQGRPTAEFFKYREIIAAFLGGNEKIPELPAAIPTIEIAAFTPTFFANLRDNTQALPDGGTFADAPYFEAFGQNQGLAFYRTTVPAGAAGTLDFDAIHDWAQVFLDGKLLATVDRRYHKKAVAVPARERAATLEILVEGMGHINYGRKMESDRKGIVGEVRLDGKALKNWTVIPKTLAEQTIADAQKSAAQDAGVPGGHFRGTFVVPEPGDTFLDMSKWGKGVLYVNGRNLGRYWSRTADGEIVGPQLRLYCPATFLKKGENTIDVIEFEFSDAREIRGFETRNTELLRDTPNMGNVW